MTWRRAELTYCTNVHPGATRPDVEANLAGPIRQVREGRGLPMMACGLWLADTAAADFAREPRRLSECLEHAGLSLMTLNGFPFADFHGQPVKAQVYEPAWDAPARLDYTLRLATLLADSLDPNLAEGTISTVPLGFAPWWSPARQDRALAQLCRAAEALARLADMSGRSIRLCLEPEPGCVVETTDQAIRLFTEALPAAAARAQVSHETLARHLGICFDVCHQAVCFEDPLQALARLQEAGIAVGKIQISSAIAIPSPTPAVLTYLAEELDEPCYLHQVYASRDGIVRGANDIREALRDSTKDAGLPTDWPWRVHFHVPIQVSSLDFQGIETTQAALIGMLDGLAKAPDPRPHLEVETYTWNVLPPGLRPDNEAALIRGLVAEIHWLEARLRERRLLLPDADETVY